MIKFTLYSPISIAICMLLIVSCDLFNAPVDANFFDKIDEEIAWANAARLDISLVLPSEWGNSPQAGRGRCFDERRQNETPREGYAFSVQFNPNPIYGDAQWRAYRTSDLLALGESWYISPASIAVLDSTDDEGNDHFKRLVSPDVIFSPEIGNLTSVTLTISDPVTIIPWTQPQPRLIAGSPPLDAHSSSHVFSANREIIRIFAAPVDANTLRFEKGFIEITGSNGENLEQLFFAPSYNADTYTLTILPRGEIPLNLVIEVKLGKNITSPGETEWLNPHVFSYTTVAADMAITSWRAEYQEAESRIEIQWRTDSNFQPTARYRLNAGPFQTVSYTDNNRMFIENIPAINYRSVREGIPVSGISMHTITLDLGEDITTIRMWNIPGMISRYNWYNKSDLIVHEIASLSDLLEMRDNVNSAGDESGSTLYILRNDIVIPDSWTPIGTAEYPFLGTFYGNGQTISINGGLDTSSADMGLFGVIDDALIRDVTVVYATAPITGPQRESHFGGITGKMEGNARIDNVIIRGALTYNVSGDNTAYVGGIAGLIAGTTSITNVWSGLNLTVNKKDPGLHSGLHVGGIAGSIRSFGANAGAKIHEVRVIGNINVDSRGNRTQLIEEDILAVGGLVGFIRGESHESRIELFQCDYQQGRIFIESGVGTVSVGGTVGLILQNALVSNSFSTARSIEIEKSGVGDLFLGGFLGSLCFIGTGEIERCYSEGLIFLDAQQGGAGIGISIGGFAGLWGLLEPDVPGLTGTISFSYSTSDVNALSYDIIKIGGFVGYSDGVIEYCYARGNVNVVYRGESEVGAGGFAGEAWDNIFDSYALGNVFVDVTENINLVYAGGLVGLSAGITRSFALGSVILQCKGDVDDFEVGGLIGQVHIYDDENDDLQLFPVINSAALGTSITMTGPFMGLFRTPGRVFGFSWAEDNSNNYAFNGMRVFYSLTYASNNPDLHDASFLSAHDRMHGADAHDGMFRDIAFWRDLGFNSEYWNFSTVVGRRHPVLRASPNGPWMGGQ